MSRIVPVAQRFFRKYPFITNSVVYGSLYVGAEYSQQYVSKRWKPLSEEPEPIDYATIGRYAVMGTTIYAPSLYVCIHL
ncbi:uncharacterized protein LOC115624692 isoform X4 [Scaptodrosophila lebanonensis]|uniref:Uncharacterized protein LOC115624692 isoform X4 n=1 Tax=Drosophila lebanonensis TaxID=7225 RepID=A0A6J2TIV0_DROLE|nr:uncharacterized protein LOC115624692 isoform X4 [Scaptodrosophila lebanonensis]